MIWALLIAFGIAVVVWAGLWRGAGIMVERNKTVEYLRKMARLARLAETEDALDDIADMIERGEHRK